MPGARTRKPWCLSPSRKPPTSTSRGCSPSRNPPAKPASLLPRNGLRQQQERAEQWQTCRTSSVLFPFLREVKYLTGIWSSCWGLWAGFCGCDVVESKLGAWRGIYSGKRETRASGAVLTHWVRTRKRERVRWGCVLTRDGGLNRVVVPSWGLPVHRVWKFEWVKNLWSHALWFWLFSSRALPCNFLFFSDHKYLQN